MESVVVLSSKDSDCVKIFKNWRDALDAAVDYIKGNVSKKYDEACAEIIRETQQDEICAGSIYTIVENSVIGIQHWNELFDKLNRYCNIPYEQRPDRYDIGDTWKNNYVLTEIEIERN